ncbi:hypothetical protein N3K66_000172 [Trichothecium roseum]|uniref:Uncharacterized protein n=1 Tax=Trichothecium roseum TaxID=47278 RepID=A0ACC0VBY5_9HYPO|nr:hypothetical protein N3K66_000172 [Trichothecium roseum]
MDRHETPDFLDSLHYMVKDKIDSKKKEELRPCPGLHSITVSGELAYSRGLGVGKCHEYDRKLTQADDIDGRRYPYNLVNLYMDSALLNLVKNAMLLQSDGLYLSCTHLLFLDIIEIYGHIQAQSNILKEIFPGRSIDALDNTSNELRFAMRLCNDLQRARKTARAWFTVADMQLISKASSMVRQVLINDSQSDKSLDLAWALLSCRDLVFRILKSLQTADFRSLLQARATCTAFRLDCRALILGNGGWHGVIGDGIYDAPRVADGEFSGLQMVAALCMVFITYYWIDAK